MVGHADMEMTVMEEGVYTHSRSLETGGTAHHAKSHEKAPGSVGRQKGGRGECDPEPLLGLSREGRVDMLSKFRIGYFE